jgi:Ca2+-binding RTX toxin-like protein
LHRRSGLVATAKTDREAGSEQRGRHRREASLAALLAAMGLFLLSPSGALASTAAKAGPTQANLTYTAANGEVNAVTVSLSGANYTIDDPGATISAGAGCTSAGVHQVTCAAAGVTRLTVKAGDRNDSVGVANSVAPTIRSNVEGGVGSDTVVGGRGDDTVVGTDFRLNQLGMDQADGSDTLEGGFGDDFIIGGPGVDTVTYAKRTTPVKANLGACNAPPELCLDRPGAPEPGLAMLVGGEIDAYNQAPADIENIIGGSANDTLIGSEASNVLKGGPGADLLAGDLQIDTVDYSDRSDPVSVTVGDNGLAATGNDGGASDGPPGARDNVQNDIENVLGGSNNDTLVGSAPVFSIHPRITSEGANVLDGGGGDDLLDGGFGPDVLEGAGGSDTVTYAGRTTAVKATLDGAADDGGAEDIDPESNRQDNIQEDVEAAVGGSSDDTLTGSSAPNALTGGPGNDFIKGGDGDDALGGGSGDDRVQGDDGNDSVLGEENNDVLLGGGGNDGLDGGPSDDKLDGGTGSDSMAGGDGSDGAFYAERLNPVTASADGAGGDGEAGEDDNVAGDVESLGGGQDNDVLVGNGGDGLIEGSGGDDTLDGGGGADTLLGGDGRDTASYAGRAAGVSVNLDFPSGDGQPGENDDIRPDVEEVAGGSGNDSLIGDGGAKSLFGGPGDDFIDGGNGADQVGGGSGNDNVEGGEGADVVKGDEGNDLLKGEFGDDILDGGSGDDSLNGGAGKDTMAGAAGLDLADYAAATKAVSVTLDGNANDGEGREGDLVRTDVESVTTGSSNDFVNSRDGVAGRISCGRGTDRVATDPDDRVAGDCEVTVAATARCSIARRSVKMSKSGAVKLKVSCPFEGKGRLTLTRGKRLGRKSFTITRDGQSKTVKVKLSRRGRRDVRRRNRLRVTASVLLRRSDVVGTSARSNASRRITIRQ